MTLSKAQGQALHTALMALVIGVASYLGEAFTTGAWLHTPVLSLVLGACGAGISRALGSVVNWLGG